MEAIVAVYSDWGIGAKGTQPISLSADRKYFRQVTQGFCVIVGKRTLDDFPGGKPLPKRVNLVLTRQDVQIPGATVVHSPQQALSLSQEYEKALVIGGASVYEQMLPFCTRVYVTKVDVCPESDVFFHNLDKDPGWVCTSSSEPGEENGIPYRFCIYDRVSL